MENLIEFKQILFGFTAEGNDKRIMAFQDGGSKESLSDAGFNSGEQVINFLIFKGDLYALVSTTTSGRLLKLATIISGSADTWEEIDVGSEFDERMHDFCYGGDKLYIFGTYNTWTYDGTTLRSIDPIPTGLSIYSSLYYADSIYLYGYLNDYGSETQILYKFNEDIGYIEVDSSATHMELESTYDVFGKKLISEYRGKLYYCFVISTDFILRSYDVSTELLVSEYTLGDSDDVYTCMLQYEGLILTSLYDTAAGSPDVKVFVPVKYEIENALVSGDGDVSESLIRVDSDPMFSNRLKSDSSIPCFASYPVVGVLKGKYGYAFKYGNRPEFYTDLDDVNSLLNINLKDLMDQLCSMTSAVFFVDGNNTARISDREVVGYPDKFKEFNQKTDFGNDYIKEIKETKEYPNDFRRIVINWNNAKWETNNPVAIGSVASIGSVFEFDSAFVNDPITAGNIATNLLKQLISVEQLDTVLSLAHYLEGTDNVSFNVKDDFIYLDKDREYKLYAVEHNLNEMTTSLIVVERVISEAKELI